MNRFPKYRQAVYSNGKFLKWHYWGFINDDTFVGVISPIKEARLNSYQFTGLLDKNGEEIYEGDILQQEFEIHEKMVKLRAQNVEWIDTDTCFGLKPSSPYEYTNLHQDRYKAEVRAIIGNIVEGIRG